MDTIHLPKAGGSHRRYAPELKAQLIAACQQPGASIKVIALAHQINPDVVRRWVRNHRLAQLAPILDAACADTPEKRIPRVAALVPVEVTVPEPFSGAIKPNRSCADQPPGAQTPRSSCRSCSIAPPTEPIRLEWRRGEIRLNVAWPTAQAESCALWLRDLMR